MLIILLSAPNNPRNLSCHLNFYQHLENFQQKSHFLKLVPILSIVSGWQLLDATIINYMHLITTFHYLNITGDKEKELWPHSDYRSKFLGEQLGKRDILPPFDKHTGPPTITGDSRTHHLGQFTTTTKSEFVGRYLKRQHLMDPSLRVCITVV